MNEDTRSRVDEARSQRGKVFDALRNAYDSSKSAWYEVLYTHGDLQAWVDEEIRGLQAICEDAQRKLADWEAKRKYKSLSDLMPPRTTDKEVSV